MWELPHHLTACVSRTWAGQGKVWEQGFAEALKTAQRKSGNPTCRLHAVLGGGALRATQNLLHLPALRQLIHQLVQISNLLCQRILDFLHTIPTDYSGDEVRIGV